MATGFHNWVKADGNSDFPAEAGRYHMYIALVCPFATRPMAVRKLKGLENVISVSIVDPRKKPDETFKFSPDKPGCTKDDLYGLPYIKDVYLKADPKYKGRFSVPLLWDKKKGTAVNNESIDIMRMLNKEFNEFCPTKEQRELDLLPDVMKDKIDEVSSWVTNINMGVYKTGGQTNQQGYEQQLEELFKYLDKAEGLLSKHRFLLGNQMTEADIRLFTTLVRFDVAYHNLFKCNKKRMADYPNLHGFICDIYQTSGVSETVNIDHIKDGYWGGSVKLNPDGVIPCGPPVDFSVPHGRDKM